MGGKEDAPRTDGCPGPMRTFVEGRLHDLDATPRLTIKRPCTWHSYKSSTSRDALVRGWS
jgi:hypothetical protein